MSTISLTSLVVASPWPAAIRAPRFDEATVKMVAGETLHVPIEVRR